MSDKTCECGRPATHFVMMFWPSGGRGHEPGQKKLMCDSFPNCKRAYQLAYGERYDKAVDDLNRMNDKGKIPPSRS